jgi:hypothetical protein
VADDVVLHTNDTVMVFEGLYRSLYDQVRVIYCYRKGGLAVFASMAVARRTNEWNYYSKKPVEPFEMDIDLFVRSLDSYYQCHKYHLQELKDRYGPDRLTVICYEDLFYSPDHRLYVCERLGLEFRPMPELPGPPNGREASTGRSPRNYREIISNYHELEKAFDEHFQRNPPPWVNGE